MGTNPTINKDVSPPAPLPGSEAVNFTALTKDTTAPAEYEDHVKAVTGFAPAPAAPSAVVLTEKMTFQQLHEQHDLAARYLQHEAARSEKLHAEMVAIDKNARSVYQERVVRIWSLMEAILNSGKPVTIKDASGKRHTFQGTNGHGMAAYLMEMYGWTSQQKRNLKNYVNRRQLAAATGEELPPKQVDGYLEPSYYRESFRFLWSRISDLNEGHLTPAELWQDTQDFVKTVVKAETDLHNLLVAKAKAKEEKVEVKAMVPITEHLGVRPAEPVRPVTTKVTHIASPANAEYTACGRKLTSADISDNPTCKVCADPHAKIPVMPLAESKDYFERMFGEQTKMPQIKLILDSPATTVEGLRVHTTAVAMAQKRYDRIMGLGCFFPRPLVEHEVDPRKIGYCMSCGKRVSGKKGIALSHRAGASWNECHGTGKRFAVKGQSETYVQSVLPSGVAKMTPKTPHGFYARLEKRPAVPEKPWVVCSDKTTYEWVWNEQDALMVLKRLEDAAVAKEKADAQQAEKQS